MRTERIAWDGDDAAALAVCLRTATTPPPGLFEDVARIIERVRRQGDAALLEMSVELDGADGVPETLRVSSAEAEAAYASLDPALREALNLAADNIRAVAQAEMGVASVDVTLPQAGIWRAYADFEMEGEKVVLGRDLFVPGDFVPESLRAVGDSDSTNGYDVVLAGREFHAGEEATLSFRIDRGGQTVEPLDPYLGADGHLVAIREDDLAYLHVHPLESSAAAGIAFAADFAEPGRYALFLQFKHEGSVQTARFTVAVAR